MIRGPWAVKSTMQNKSHAMMAQRTEADDSPDDFPTPPWATRSLIEHVLRDKAALAAMTCLEPACGAGHMAKVLKEYFREVRCAEAYPYGYGPYPLPLAAARETQGTRLRRARPLGVIEVVFSPTVPLSPLRKRGGTERRGLRAKLTRFSSWIVPLPHFDKPLRLLIFRGNRSAFRVERSMERLCGTMAIQPFHCLERQKWGGATGGAVMQQPPIIFRAAPNRDPSGRNHASSCQLGAWQCVGKY